MKKKEQNVAKGKKKAAPKSAAKKSSAKKPAAKKPAAKKPVAKKSVAKKSALKKTAVKKTAAKKAASKKTTAPKTSANKVTAKTSAKAPAKTSKTPAKVSSSSATKTTSSSNAKATSNMTAKPAMSSAKKSSSENLDLSGFITPLDDRVLVLPKEKETMTAGGLFIPDTAGEQGSYVEGLVVSVGRGHRSPKGHLRPMDVQLGDRILFSKFSGNDLKIQDYNLLILREADVLGVVS
jgi:chaperonin GroES